MAKSVINNGYNTNGGTIPNVSYGRPVNTNTTSSGNNGSKMYNTYSNTPQVRSANEMSKLMGGYNYDEDYIRSLFNKATKAEYAAKRAANVEGQREYAKDVGGYINNLSDTMRNSINKAVATGGSRGLAAAQAMQAAQNATQQTAEGATKLAQDNINLDYEEAAAYAQNAKAAEELAATRMKDMLNGNAALYGYDTTLFGNELYGSMGQRYGANATKYNADINNIMNTRDNETENNKSIRDTEASIANNIRTNTTNFNQTQANIIKDLYLSRAISADAYNTYAQMLGLPDGSLIGPPKVQTTSSSGSSGSGGSSGSSGYSKNTSGSYSNSNVSKAIDFAKNADNALAQNRAMDVATMDALNKAVDEKNYGAFLSAALSSRFPWASSEESIKQQYNYWLAARQGVKKIQEAAAKYSNQQILPKS